MSERTTTSSAARFGLGGHAAVNALWLGIQFQDVAILPIIIPAILLQIDRIRHTNVHTDVLALLATLAAIATTFVPMVAGALSDRARRRGGDRRRETAIALAVDVLALCAMAVSHSAGLLGIEVVAASIAIAAASTIYQALLPDVVPKSAWGTAAGVRGAMTLFGTVLGLAAAAKLTPTIALFVMALFIVLSATSLLAIRRDRPHAQLARAPAIVRDWHDLGITLVARGWIVLGMTLLQTYILYFFNDVLHVRDAPLGTSLVAGASLVGAVVSSIVTGVLSDRVDRRVIVAISGVPMTLAALGFGLAPQANLIFLYAALFGLGYGGVFSVGWALALDTIPELGDAARDLGIWGTVSNLPSVFAPAIGGWMIVHAATPRDGYRGMFALAGGCFFVGSLIVLRVGARPVASIWSALFVAVVCLFRRPYLFFRVRVRQWGRLPFRRGPTVLIANHQHEDEAEALCERTFMQGPWRAPTMTASTRRMYEPGFFAWRMPWLAPIARNLNAGGMFYALGMLPLENMLSAQPVRSLALAVRATHGNLDVMTVFRDAALAVLPAGARTLDDLLGPAHFAAGEREIKIAYLHESYRREAIERMRASIEEDVARIVDVTRRGATFFVTPEGFYSTDGRMRPLRGIVDRLLTVAEPWLAAIAYDPFRGRRLSFMYRIVRPADPHDLAASLAAARPVTTSALLARWLLAVDLPFADAEAREGVIRALAALPPDAFVDPEVRRDPDGVVAEALAVMTRRGLLVTEGAQRRLAAERTDRRFPGVADVVAYQATFLEETIAALERLAAPRDTLSAT